eukprot:c21974_g1_i2 orf=43-627(+)
MGNHMCMCSAAHPQRASDFSKNLIKFLHCETGAISEFEGPLTAAEVMMEFPAQFICCFSSVISSGAARRIGAVLADEELRATELYLLLPMHKLNTRFSAEDMAVAAALVSQLCTAGKQSSKGIARSQSKVAPLPASKSCTQSSIPEGGLSGRSCLSFKTLDAAGQDHMKNMQGQGRAKAWVPKLETIRETNAAL